MATNWKENFRLRVKAAVDDAGRVRNHVQVFAKKYNELIDLYKDAISGTPVVVQLGETHIPIPDRKGGYEAITVPILMLSFSNGQLQVTPSVGVTIKTATCSVKFNSSKQLPNYPSRSIRLLLDEAGDPYWATAIGDEWKRLSEEQLGSVLADSLLAE